MKQLAVADRGDAGSAAVACPGAIVRHGAPGALRRGIQMHEISDCIRLVIVLTASGNPQEGIFYEHRRRPGCVMR